MDPRVMQIIQMMMSRQGGGGNTARATSPQGGLGALSAIGPPQGGDGGLGALRGLLGGGAERPTFRNEPPPVSPSYGPGGPVLNFTGGSPFPAQDRTRQALASLVLGTRLLEVQKARKPQKPAKGNA